MGGPVLSCVANQHIHMHRIGNRTLSIITHATNYYSPSGLSASFLRYIMYYKHLKFKITYPKLRFSNIDGISNCSEAKKAVTKSLNLVDTMQLIYTVPTLYPENDLTQLVEYYLPGVDTLSMLDCE